MRTLFFSLLLLLGYQLNAQTNLYLIGDSTMSDKRDPQINPETGYVIDVKILKDIIKSEIEDRFDHKNLNLDVEEFKTLNPTAENIVVVIYNKIKAKLASNLELEVTLYETPRNFVTYSGK